MSRAQRRLASFPRAEPIGLPHACTSPAPPPGEGRLRGHREGGDPESPAAGDDRTRPRATPRVPCDPRGGRTGSRAPPRPHLPDISPRWRPRRDGRAAPRARTAACCTWPRASLRTGGVEMRIARQDAPRFEAVRESGSDVRADDAPAAFLERDEDDGARADARAVEFVPRRRAIEVQLDQEWSIGITAQGASCPVAWIRIPRSGERPRHRPLPTEGARPSDRRAPDARRGARTRGAARRDRARGRAAPRTPPPPASPRKGPASGGAASISSSARPAASQSRDQRARRAAHSRQRCSSSGPRSADSRRAESMSRPRALRASTSGAPRGDRATGDGSAPWAVTGRARRARCAATTSSSGTASTRGPPIRPAPRITLEDGDRAPIRSASTSRTARARVRAVSARSGPHPPRSASRASRADVPRPGSTTARPTVHAHEPSRARRARAAKASGLTPRGPPRSRACTRLAAGRGTHAGRPPRRG